MVQNTTKGKEDVRIVNAEQGNSNKLVYLLLRITALSSTKLHSRSYTSTPEISRNFFKEFNSIVARLLNRILLEKLDIPEGFSLRLNNFQLEILNNSNKPQILRRIGMKYILLLCDFQNVDYSCADKKI